MKKIIAVIFCFSVLLIATGLSKIGKVPVKHELETAESEIADTADSQSVPLDPKTSEESTKETDLSGIDIGPGNNSYGVEESYILPDDINDSTMQDMTDSDPDRPTGSDSLHIYRFSNDLGSSRNLRGNVAVYCFFVDDDESSWTKREADRFLREQINPALEFLTTQAKNWNVDLEFSVLDYCNETAGFSLKYNGVVNADLTDGGSTKDVFEQIAVNMGYASGSDFTVSEDAKNSYDDSVYLTFINKSGRSYTRNLYNESAAYYLDDDFPEVCVIFSGGARIIFTECSVTIAHEILHLFGAEDYYGETRRQLANQDYYFDVMIMNTRSIFRTQVGDMTAFCVGWIDDTPKLCYNDVWVSSRFEEL